MIIGSTTPLNTSETAPVTHIGNWGGLFVYKTSSQIEAIKETTFNESREIVDLTDAIEKLRSELDTAQGISAWTQRVIRNKYSLESELKALRTGSQEYKAFIDQVIAEHNAAKDALFSV
jgi:hypothetical protein